MLYTGITNNLAARLKEHYDLRGNPQSFTGKYYCYNLAYYEHYQYVNEAIAREKEIKIMLRAKKEALIGSVNPDWKFFNRFI